MTCCIGLSLAQDSYTLEYEYRDIVSSQRSTIANLVVQGNEAVFKVMDDQKAGTKILKSKEPNRVDIAVINNDELATFTYSTKKEIYIRIPYKGKRDFIYKFDASELNWEFSDETKTVNQYECQKATLDLHGRKYEAWFTTEVPIAFGPMRLNGLPGVIVEVTIFDPYDEQHHIQWKLLRIHTSESNEIFKSHKEFFTANKVMNYTAYEKEAIQTMVDVKINKLANAAAIAAQWAKEDGYESEYTLTLLPTYFFAYFIDIPEGAWEELEKID